VGQWTSECWDACGILNSTVAIWTTLMMNDVMNACEEDLVECLGNNA
jgi:hypothetical protein